MPAPKSTRRRPAERQTVNTRRTRRYPDWYYRVVALAAKEDREVESDDFEEDLSELESESDEDYFEVSVEEYDKHTLYYDLRNRREEYKEWMIGLKKKKADKQKFERSREEKVQKVYDDLQGAEMEGDLPDLDCLDGKRFRLYCADHVEYCNNPDTDWLRELQLYWSDLNTELLPVEGTPTHIAGEIIIDSDRYYTFNPFPHPGAPSREEVRAESSKGGHEIVFQFVSDKYLIMTVSRELVFMHGGPPPASCPERFRFVGVFYTEEEMDMRRLGVSGYSPSPPAYTQQPHVFVPQ
ncbi:hypothetical protein GGS23DRAFT_268200 [Durotheca rogersii]|uniref:uncharacterized protein n=1 Tax=Durotheca rogersii TaxID=419775 RepID=UPI00221F5DB2|nr:uncharacterized protein GGS23DRAFT_268200 [Durotheca rogersii]KAI5859737.1 hypothetical protein GGS23DRAFT_268200 [Durotheca rogersii]